MALHNPSIPSDGIKNECRVALKLLRDNKDHRDAVRWIDKYCSPRNPKTAETVTADSALCHRVMATIYTKAASGAAKDKDRWQFARTAIEYARKAVNQCPNSIEFAHFYANLLYEAARRRNEYKRVEEECRRALLIENPVDPAVESLLEEYEQKLSTAEGRVGDVRNQLRLLIQKSNFAAHAPWVKDLGDGEENVQFLPMTRKPEDPMYEIPEVKKGSGNAGNENSTDVRETIRSYWNTLSSAARKDIFRIQISELRKFRESFRPLKDKAYDDALSFGVENKTWKFWRCCDKEFTDGDLFMKHVSENHDCTSLPENMRLEPERVEDEWAWMLQECHWKPLELNEVIGNEDGPLFDEPERAMLLEKIRVIFQSLIENKYLALSQINWVRRYAMEELQSLACSADILSSKLMENPSCIRVLGAPALTKILDFLQEMFDASGLSRHSDKSDAADNSNTGADFVEKIIFSPDSKSLIIEVPRSLPPKVSGLSSDVAAAVNYEDGEVLDSDTLLSWLFEGPGITEALESWDWAKEKKLHKCSETIRSLEEEFLHVLQRLYLRKRDHISYSDAPQHVENICSDWRKNRGNSTGFLSRSYDSFLRKRQNELIDSIYENYEEVMISSRFELYAITNVLKEAESLNVNQFDTEMTYDYEALRSHLCVLESSKDVDQRTKKELLHQLDSCIEVSIHRQKEHISFETSKHDARLMQAIAGVKDLRNELVCASSHDYRSILIPLLRSFLQKRLKDLALKHAAITSLLTNNNALDSKNLKHGSSNDKKKGQKNRATQASKDNSLDETHDLKTTEERLHPSGQDDGTEEQLNKDDVDGDGGKETLENSDSSVYCSGSVIDVSALGIHRRGLINDVGENNCFLNAIIQSLWHLPRFRDEFMREQSGHLHVGVPCVICALYEVFIDLGTAPRDNRGQSVSPAHLRFALSKRSSKFPLNDMCSALEVFDEILNCLHTAFKNSPDVPGAGSEVSAGTDSGDCCTNSPCIAHSLFGMDVTQNISCDKGFPEAIYSEYKSYSHFMRAGHFRTNKEYTIDKILYHDGWDRKPCGHCGTGSPINRTISKLPHVYTIDLDWGTEIESVNNIMETLEAFRTEFFDPSIFCTNPVPNSKYRLVSVACFIGAGRHYICFVYDRDREDWIIFNDTIVEVVGSWEDVLRMCEKGKFQPNVWMYELEN